MADVAQTPEFVFLVVTCRDAVWVERRRLISAAAEVMVSHALMPGGERVRPEALAFDWPTAVAKYWEAERKVRDRLRKQLRNLERRIAKGAEPRFLKREG